MLPTLPTIHNAAALDELAQPLRGVTSSARLLDVLSDFAPGQKMVALIQAQLPNGAYRAAIGQRDVTLALPFAARPGDALELKVVEHRGRVAFAVTAAQAEAAEQEAAATTVADGGRPAPAVTARLSAAGQTIAHLLSGDDDTAPPAVPLNGGRPVLAAPSAEGGEIAPALRDAVASSGLFYESHLAQWTAGQRATATLAGEPQARFAPPPVQNSTPVAASSAQAAQPAQATTPPPSPEADTPALIREHFGMRPPRAVLASAPAPAGAGEAKATPAASTEAAEGAAAPTTTGQAVPTAAPQATPGARLTPAAPSPLADGPPGAAGGPPPRITVGGAPALEAESATDLSARLPDAVPAEPPAAVRQRAAPATERELPDNLARTPATGAESGPAAAPARSAGLPGELAPLVQQQLLSLANHQYPFHGVLWPGQKIEWEIVDEDGRSSREQDGEAPRQWKTRLKLLLPSLGGIDATIELDATDVKVRMDTNADTETRLRGQVAALARRLENAGLRLTALDFKTADGDTPEAS